MKTLSRNKRPLYYATYLGKQPVYDEDGLYTGLKAIGYSPVVKVKMNVGVDLGTAGLAEYGITDPFTVAIATDDTSCPITTTSIVWLDQGNLSEYSEETEYSEGDKTMKDGTIKQYVNGAWVDVPHTHTVLRVATSLNSVTYLVRQVEVSV